ncbi:MAG: hypothetical protein C0593_05815 [Marinilabiliales bacterium]|nr:MAG: hypothetical protein C0593_05815 [Marinilabiliales bacterium]
MLKLCLMAAIIFISGSAWAQINSPYSNFGLGNLQQEKSMFYKSMGGVGYGMNSDLYINPSNPATYAEFDTLSFIFDMAVYTESRGLNTVRESESYNYAGIDYITFAFPVTKWWKSSLGVLPFSKVDYQMVDGNTVPGVGYLEYNYEGSGGINKAYIGNALRFGKKNYFAIGANFNYLFGTTMDVQAVSFPDSVYYFYTKNTQSINWHDFYFDFGAYYHYEFGKDDEYVLGFGAVYTLGDEINTTENRLSYNYIQTSTGVDYIKDTLTFVEDISGTIGLPQTIGGGFSVKKKNKFHFGVDAEYQNWETFHINGENELMENSLRFAAGGQFMPGGETVGSYWRWVRYRAGFYYNQSALQVNNTGINEFGITFGLGLPLRRSRSTINLGLEIGNRGTTDNDLIQETFVNFRLGFSIYENWFIQRKFN